MSFTPGQQGKFRPMVAKAWQSHCKGNALDPRDKAAREDWYRGELLACLGRDTTKDANTGRDFDIVMAHFETFIFGECYWNLKIAQGETRRMLHTIHSIAEQYDFDDAYARSVAAKVLKWEGYLVSLNDITDPKDLVRVRTALLIQGRRVQKRVEQAKAGATQANPTPTAPEIGGGLRAINTYYGATEAEFESEGVKARREAAKRGTEEFRKLARKQFAQDKRERAAAARKAKSPAVSVDPDNCPF
jgi:hypothetical protein